MSLAKIHAEKIVTLIESDKESYDKLLPDVIDIASEYYKDVLRFSHRGYNITKWVSDVIVPGIKFLPSHVVGDTDIVLSDGSAVRVMLFADAQGGKITKLQVTVIYLEKHPEVSYKYKIKETKSLMAIK